MSNTANFNNYSIIHFEYSSHYSNIHFDDFYDNYDTNAEDMMDLEYESTCDDDTYAVNVYNMMDNDSEQSSATECRYNEAGDVIVNTACGFGAKMDSICHGMSSLGLNEDSYIEMVDRLSEMTICDEIEDLCSGLSRVHIESERYAGPFVDQWKALVQYFALDKPAIRLIRQ